LWCQLLCGVASSWPKPPQPQPDRTASAPTIMLVNTFLHVGARWMHGGSNAGRYTSPALPVSATAPTATLLLHRLHRLHRPTKHQHQSLLRCLLHHNSAHHAASGQPTRPHAPAQPACRRGLLLLAQQTDIQPAYRPVREAVQDHAAQVQCLCSGCSEMMVLKSVVLRLEGRQQRGAALQEGLAWSTAVGGL
jgi:hypothetical protein